MAATPGVPTAAQREGRIEPPPMPYGELGSSRRHRCIAGEGATSNVLMTAVPMLGSVGSVVFVAMSGKSAQSYLAAGLFLLASLGFVGVSIWRTRSGKTAPGDQQPPRVPQLPARHPRSRPARRLRAAQAPHLDPPRTGRPRRVAEEGTRVWERAPSDEDWLLVRYARGPQRLGLELKPPESDTIDKLDPVSASALHRLLATHRILPDLPTAVALNSFARIEITGSEDHARAQARALLVQAATFHAPDQLVDRRPHRTPRAPRTGTGSSGSPTRRAAARPTRPGRAGWCAPTSTSSCRCCPPTSASARGSARPARRCRHTSSSSSTTPPSRSATRSSPSDGVLGMTVIDIPERWDELSDDSRVRLHLEA